MKPRPRQRKGQGRLYRYYVSTAVQQGRQAAAGTLARIPAPPAGKDW